VKCRDCGVPNINSDETGAGRPGKELNARILVAHSIGAEYESADRIRAKKQQPCGDCEEDQNSNSSARNAASRGVCNFPRIAEALRLYCTTKG
jgi:hypothetical protein